MLRARLARAVKPVRQRGPVQRRRRRLPVHAHLADVHEGRDHAFVAEHPVQQLHGLVRVRIVRHDQVEARLVAGIAAGIVRDRRQHHDDRLRLVRLHVLVVGAELVHPRREMIAVAGARVAAVAGHDRVLAGRQVAFERARIQEGAGAHQTVSPQHVEELQLVVELFRRPLRHEPLLGVDLPAGAAPLVDDHLRPAHVGVGHQPERDARAAVEGGEVVVLEIHEELVELVVGRGVAVLLIGVQPHHPVRMGRERIVRPDPPDPGGDGVQRPVEAVRAQVTLVRLREYRVVLRVVEVLVQRVQPSVLGQVGEQPHGFRVEAHAGNDVRHVAGGDQGAQRLQVARALGANAGNAELLLDPLVTYLLERPVRIAERPVRGTRAHAPDPDGILGNADGRSQQEHRQHDR